MFSFQTIIHLAGITRMIDEDGGNGNNTEHFCKTVSVQVVHLSFHFVWHTVDSTNCWRFQDNANNN